MPGDPKDCRQHAANCMQLAESAISPDLRQRLIDLAKQWDRIAVELEDTQALLNTLNQLDLGGTTASDDLRQGQ